MPFDRWLYGWRVRLRTLIDRDGADRDLDDELRHHVALETEARRAKGTPQEEARRQALATLGGLESARHQVRDARFGAALEHVLQDVRYVLRVLRRNPGFTATTVLTLTLAISATTATFSVVDAVLLQPPPFPEPERLVTLWETDPENGNQPAEVASANFLDWREQATSFEGVAALDPWSVDLTGADAPEVLYGWQVTEGFFETLGAGATLGRTFLPDEHRPGSGVLAGSGVATGLLASLLFSQTLTSLLFDVAPFDAATLAGVSLLLLAVAAAAAWSPARRASRVDPLVALRTE